MKQTQKRLSGELVRCERSEKLFRRWRVEDFWSIENAMDAVFCALMCGKSTQFRRNRHVFAVVGTNSPVNVECANMSHELN